MSTQAVGHHVSTQRAARAGSGPRTGAHSRTQHPTGLPSAAAACRACHRCPRWRQQRLGFSRSSGSTGWQIQPRTARPPALCGSAGRACIRGQVGGGARGRTARGHPHGAPEPPERLFRILLKFFPWFFFCFLHHATYLGSHGEHAAAVVCTVAGAPAQHDAQPGTVTRLGCRGACNAASCILNGRSRKMMARYPRINGAGCVASGLCAGCWRSWPQQRRARAAAFGGVWRGCRQHGRAGGMQGLA